MFCYAALGQRAQTTATDLPLNPNLINARLTPPAEEKKESNILPIVAVVGAGALLIWVLS